jgi:hypothetical protein
LSTAAALSAFEWLRSTCATSSSKPGGPPVMGWPFLCETWLMRRRLPSAECGLAKETGRAAPGVPMAVEVDGGGLFTRAPVSVRKAAKRAWVDERRSGVRVTSSGGRDMRPSREPHVYVYVFSSVPWERRNYRCRGNRRGLWQWHGRIESGMGASFWWRAADRAAVGFSREASGRPSVGEGKFLCVQGAHAVGAVLRW